MKPSKRGWVARIVIFGMAMGVVPSAFSGASIPLTRDFLDGLGDGVTTNSTDPGRVRLVADTAALRTNSIPPRIVLSPLGSESKVLHVNFFDCDRSVVLYRQGMYLRRPIGCDVDFAIYEEITNGTFSLVSESSVSVPAGSNVVYSGVVDVPLEEGIRYAFGAAWGDTLEFRYSIGPDAQPSPTPFGQTIAAGNVHPGSVALPSTLSTNDMQSELLYFQYLIWSSNRVVRMDSAGGWATNQMDLLVDLQGYDEVSLTFRHRSSGDEQHGADGVFISVNGGSDFTKIESLTNEPTWTLHAIDLDRVAESNGMTFSANTKIRFQQYDDVAWGRDGREFDDVQVYSTPVLSIEPVSNSLVRLRVKDAPVGRHCQVLFRSELGTNEISWLHYAGGAFQTDGIHPSTNWIMPDSLNGLFYKLQLMNEF